MLPKKLCSGIIYSFNCNSCNIIYYGKTKRHFYIRAAEHMGISHLTNKRLKNVKQSAISDHLLTCDCNINFDDFTILSKDSNNINLLIKESLLKSRDKPILNKTGIRFWPCERRILPELILYLTSNSLEPALKHLSKARAKSGPQAKIFHFSKAIYELLQSLFPKYANKTTLVQYNFIHDIVSQHA